MASNNKECIICFDPYDERAHKPLALPCGHTFCMLCLYHLEGSETKKCPTCKRDWSRTRVDELNPIYQLIADSDINETGQTEYCKVHQRNSICMFCFSCKADGCVECLSGEHRDCEWKLLKEAEDTMKAKLKAQVKKTKVYETSINTRIDLTENFLSTVRAVITSLRTAENDLVEHKNRLTSAKSAIPENCEAPVNTNTELSSAQNLQAMQEKLDALQYDQDVVPLNVTPIMEMAQTYQAASSDPPQLCERPANSPKPLTTNDNINSVTIEMRLRYSKEWHITDPLTSEVATRLLLSARHRPNIVRVTSDNKYKFTCRTPLFDILRITECEVSLVLKCSLRDPSDETRRQDSEILEKLLENSRCKCKLVVFRGHLSEAAAKLLPHSVTSLTLVLHDENDVRVLASIDPWANLKELWCCPGRRPMTTPASTWALRGLWQKCIGLEFRGASNVDVWWIAEVIEFCIIMLRHSAVTTFQLRLPECQLTMKGLLLLVRGVLLVLQQHPTITRQHSMAVESAAMTKVDRQQILNTHGLSVWLTKQFLDECSILYTE